MGYLAYQLYHQYLSYQVHKGLKLIKYTLIIYLRDIELFLVSKSYLISDNSKLLPITIKKNMPFLIKYNLVLALV